jgi:hypothetical protein
MKGLFGVLLVILIVYAIYIDLTVGTLPNTNKTNFEAEPTSAVVKQVNRNMPVFEEKVKPGDTVISIVEHHINKPLPVSITDLIDDFRKLNPGENPEKIQIGVTYQFPDY